MKLSAILLARAIAYVEVYDLSPRGKIFYPDIVPEIVKRYKFQKFPKAIEEFDETKGIEFLEGKSGDTLVSKFTVFNTLLVLETRSNTDDSRRILEEMLEWGAEKFKLNYHPGMIKRFAYVSAATFHSDVPLLNFNRVLANLSEKTSKALSEIWQEPVQYEPVQQTIGHDPLTRKYGIAPFTITHRAEARFSENKYFSEAPLPTDLHLKFLEEYEREVATEIKLGF